MIGTKHFPAQKFTQGEIEIEFPAYSVAHVAEPRYGKHEGDNWQKGADEFRFEINGNSFSYYTGVGHRKFAKSYNAMELQRSGLSLNAWGKVTESGHKKLLEATTAVFPSLESLIESIMLDGSACDESFESWAGNFGYDTDSRKALEIYMACQENYSKLRRAWDFNRATLEAYFEAKND